MAGRNREPFFLYRNQYIIFRVFPVSTRMNRDYAKHRYELAMNASSM